ncbi:hypothetical protein [Desulforhopalus sp. IMCC35007]|uniref:hypothetical protein n=1 Tax=Desulforhopalus sp. IMCC35007 TaxID=2569543 RepID=UPI0010ADF46A|nr:hypothetical protein [Desulforhopalus sp. IMCC35007]TKB09586.1 hypothetical protein FCL48_09035 [Desulforhopalus sp. IMCC35007]
MKTKKKLVPGAPTNIDDIIAGGTSTQLEEKVSSGKKDGRGRPKGKITKKACMFRLPLDVIEAIDANCGGNKSVFAEEIFRDYFKRNSINIK